MLIKYQDFLVIGFRLSIFDSYEAQKLRKIMKEVLGKACVLALLSFSSLLLADSVEKTEDSTISSDAITFVGKVSFPAEKAKQLLGASSIRYDEARKRFIILSDDTGAYPNVFGVTAQPRYFTVKLEDIWSEEHQGLLENLTEKLPKLLVHSIVPNDSLKDIFGGSVDIESATTFGDDELLIVSENGVWEWNAYPSLLKVNKNNKLKGIYHFPDRYTDDQPWYKTLSHYPHQYQDVSGKGIKRNKGIESLDRITGTNEYIAIVEGPLIQDEREWENTKKIKMVPARLLHFSMEEFLSPKSNTGTVSLLGEYFYPFEPLLDELSRNALEGYPKRSISDVEVINKDYAIVLEKSYIKYRNFDSRKPKSVAELYLVELGSSYNFADSGDEYPNVIKSQKKKVLKKTLLMRSTEMEDQLPEFTRLNIEGITLGPQFADGSRLMALVNDNDAYNAKVDVSSSEPTSKLRPLAFSKSSIMPTYLWAEGGWFDTPLFRAKEPTHMLFFKVPAAMLGAKE